MARKDAVLRIHQRLVAKRDALRRKLRDEFGELGERSKDVGDIGDVALNGSSTELDSQLAALESRELRQIDRAIELIREGRYGNCENCEQPIPIARLKAVPFTLLCVQCQRKLEEFGQSADDIDADWESAYEYEGRLSERDVSLGDLELES